MNMELNEYQKKAGKTAKYPQVGSNFLYPTLGLAGEAGEVANAVKKIFRDKEGRVDDDTREHLKGELGDVLWYVAQLARELGISLEDIGESNIRKLYSRMERGVLGGSGDKR